MNSCSGKPWMSVIVPVYNAEKYLVKCIRSILSQTFTDFELILVDDGSSDSSGEICRSFCEKDPRVKFFHKENGGSLQTRVYGAEKSSGEYVFFCDADDYYYDENSFEIIYKNLICSGGDYDLVQFGVVNKLPYIKRNKDIHKSLVIEKYDFFEYHYPILLCSYFEYSKITGNVWNKAYKSSLLKNLPQSNDIPRVFMGDDFIMNLYLLRNVEKVLCISQQIYVYRNMLGGSGSFRKNEIENLNILKEYQWKFLQEWNGAYKNKVIRMHFAETAGWLYNYVQNSLKYLSEEELKQMIVDSLDLPNIKRAREYLKNNNENYPEFKLLVAGDPDLYISEAKKLIANRSMKDKLKDWAKTILRKILK